MVSRLVLGCDPKGYGVVESLRKQRGDLRVICQNEGRVKDLREANVTATVADPTDDSVLRDLEADPDIVFLNVGDPNRTITTARSVSDRFDCAQVIAVVDLETSEEHRVKLERAVDKLVDVREEVSNWVSQELLSRGTHLSHHLRRQLGRIDGRLAVMMHDNPDPDAIGSAMAMVRIAERLGLEADPCYFGDISHQENRALVNLLSLPLVNLSSMEDLERYEGFALVDHSRPGINDQLPKDTPIDVVVDHHPPRAPVDAGFADLRSDVGSTSTLMTQYLDRFGIDLDKTVSTALLYGIRVDTDDFTREVSRADFRAAATLLPHVDGGVLERVEHPSISTETIDVISRAIKNRDIRRDALVSWVGTLGDRDALAQAAERLLEMEGIQTTIVFGIRDETVFVSARTRAPDLDLGETLRVAYGDIGSAGGHNEMAGAQIPLGVISQVEESEDDRDASAVARSVLTERFFEVIRLEPIELGGFLSSTEKLAPPPDFEDQE